MLYINYNLKMLYIRFLGMIRFELKYNYGEYSK